MAHILSPTLCAPVVMRERLDGRSPATAAEEWNEWRA